MTPKIVRREQTFAREKSEMIEEEHLSSPNEVIQSPLLVEVSQVQASATGPSAVVPGQMVTRRSVGQLGRKVSVIFLFHVAVVLLMIASIFSLKGLVMTELQCCFWMPATSLNHVTVKK